MSPSITFGDIRNLDPAEFRATLQQHQITRIDTAAWYQQGKSEEIIGAAKLGHDFTIDTKILTQLPAAGSLTAAKIERSLTRSLQVLGLEKVNVLHTHAPDNETPVAEQARAFHEQYVRGRFTHLGVCNTSPAMLQEWLDIAEREGYVKPTVYQGQYNLLCRTLEETLFPLLRANGIAFSGYSPLAGGFLLGNFTAEGVQGGQRFQLNTPFKKWYDQVSMHKAVKALRVISEGSGIGMDELSLRWLMNHSALREGDAIIMGASKIAQIGPSVEKVRSGPLPADVVQEMNRLWDNVKNDAANIVEY